MSNIAKPTYDELMALVNRKNEEIAALKAKGQRSLSVKVHESGTISLYGLGRFPVSLYASQWTALFTMVDTIKKTIADNPALLQRKEKAA